MRKTPWILRDHRLCRPVYAFARGVDSSDIFVRHDLPDYFQTWSLAEGWYQVLGYVLAFSATLLLFGMLYRVVPNAGQHIADIWPGTVTASMIFVVIAQAFPIYLRLLGGFNRYGAAFAAVAPRSLVLVAGAHTALRNLCQRHLPAPTRWPGAAGVIEASDRPESCHQA